MTGPYSNNFRLLLLCDYLGYDSPLSPKCTVSTRNELRAAGMQDDHGEITDKGRAYIDGLDAVPEPVQTWSIP
ncbi:hypothetical protein H4CHR_02932 [Variovorax sp. PBS-H4]|uniref:hypothetical protein n=1 Tax=Variovorax sp. PBS-H4 TaxID=434008 RepID=UPI00131897C6|nr:hypothetical protein [Variovorax sp. PBS-H4]VTU32051.1 hypothetical protein H4CHR_02932 [Variovorax sp. PBS-H4]